MWSIRKIVFENEIDKILFEKVTDHLIKVFDVNTDNQRIDSVHIQSNMRKLGRIRIIASTIKRFVVNLKRQYPDQLGEISEDIKTRYKNDNALSIFSLVKPSESRKTLDQVSQDLFDLCQLFKDHNQIKAMSSYGTMLRVLKEQCNLGEDNTAKAKPAKKITSDSLQNPSDPDATYDGHKGQGFQAQIEETWSENDKEGNAVELITYVEVEPAHNSDAHALMPAIKETKERGVAPKELLADSLYGGDDNVEQALLEGVEVVSPTMGKENKTTSTLSDFVFSDAGTVIKCPTGHKPVSHKKNKDKNTVTFAIETCSDCQTRSQCPVKRGKKYFYLRFKDKNVRLAKRRTHEKTDSFKDRYRYRSGVEATMSEYDRLTGVKHLRVRGLKAVRFCATMKALAVNIYRVTAAVKAGMQRGYPENDHAIAFVNRIVVFKEHFFSSQATFREKVPVLKKNRFQPQVA